MSLVQQVSDAFTRVGTEFKTAYGRIGNLGNLTTAAKGDLVTAVNEVKGSIPAIQDAATANNTLWSSNKTNTAIGIASDAVKAEILGGAGPLWDTLQELHDIEINDESTVTQIIADLGMRLRFDAAQALTAGQKAQGQANLDVPSNTQVGDTAVDLVGIFNTALL